MSAEEQLTYAEDAARPGSGSSSKFYSNRAATEFKKAYQSASEVLQAHSDVISFTSK